MSNLARESAEPPLGLNQRQLRVGLLAATGRTLDAFFVTLAAHWRQQLGFEVFTAAGSAPESFSDTTILPGLERRPGPGAIRAVRGLRAWVDHSQLDLVITNTATPSALIRLARVSAPVVYWAHGLHWSSEGLSSLPFRVAEAALLPRTSGVITINSDDLHWFSRRRVPADILYLPQGVGLDTNAYPRLAPGRAGLPLRLVWIGELSERKNPVALIALAQEFQRRGVDFQLRLLGSGPLAAVLGDAIFRAGLSQQITLVGRTDPLPHFEWADVVVHTSHWEGLPRVLLEALAVGRPVAAYDAKGVRDIFGAHLATYGDACELADCCLAAAHAGPVRCDRDELDYRRVAATVGEFVARIADRAMASGMARELQ